MLEMPSDGIVIIPRVANTNKIRFEPSKISFTNYLQ